MTEKPISDDPRMKHLDITIPVMGYLFAIMAIDHATQSFLEPGQAAIPEKLRTRHIELVNALTLYRTDFLEMLDEEVVEAISYLEKQTKPTSDDMREFFDRTGKPTAEDARSGTN